MLYWPNIHILGVRSSSFVPSSCQSNCEWEKSLFVNPIAGLTVCCPSHFLELTTRLALSKSKNFTLKAFFGRCFLFGDQIRKSFRGNVSVSHQLCLKYITYIISRNDRIVDLVWMGVNIICHYWWLNYIGCLQYELYWLWCVCRPVRLRNPICGCRFSAYANKRSVKRARSGVLLSRETYFRPIS